MSEAFDPLLIKIQSIADLKAVTQARNEMQALQNQVPMGTDLWKQMDTSIKAMDDSLSKVANKTLPETSEKTEDSEKQMHKLHMAMRMFGGQLGEVGHLAHAFMLGFGEIASIVVIFREIEKAVHAVREEMLFAREMGNQWSENLIKSSAAALASFKTEMEGWDTSNKHLLDANDQLTKAMENQIKLQQTLRAGVNEIKDATKALTDALRALEVTRGGATETAAQVEKMKADAKAKQEKEDREYEGKQADLGLHRARIEKMPAEAEEADKKAKDLAGGEQKEAQTRFNAAQHEKDDAEARMNTAKKAIADAQADMDILTKFKEQQAHPDDSTYFEKMRIQWSRDQIALAHGRTGVPLEDVVQQRLGQAKTDYSTKRGSFESESETTRKYTSELADINAEIAKNRAIYENREKAHYDETVKYNSELENLNSARIAQMKARDAENAELDAKILDIRIKRIAALEKEGETTPLAGPKAEELNWLYVAVQTRLKTLGETPGAEAENVSGMIVALSKEMRLSLATKTPPIPGTEAAIEGLKNEIAAWNKRDADILTPAETRIVAKFNKAMDDLTLQLQNLRGINQ